MVPAALIFKSLCWSLRLFGFAANLSACQGQKRQNNWWIPAISCFLQQIECQGLQKTHRRDQVKVKHPWLHCWSGDVVLGHATWISCRGGAICPGASLKPSQPICPSFQEQTWSGFRGCLNAEGRLHKATLRLQPSKTFLVRRFQMESCTHAVDLGRYEMRPAVASCRADTHWLRLRRCRL